jgi:hypothetical protein
MTGSTYKKIHLFMHTLDCFDYLIYESVVVVLVLLDERRTAGVDEPVSSALSSLPN